MLRWSGERVFFLLLLSGIFAFSAFVAVEFMQDLFLQRKILQVERDLRRLNLAAIAIIRQGAQPHPDLLWRAMGLAGPLVDPWRTQYRMIGEGRVLQWASAGPDGIWNTRDDLNLSMAKVSKDLPNNGNAIDKIEDTAPVEIPAK